MFAASVRADGQVDPVGGVKVQDVDVPGVEGGRDVNHGCTEGVLWVPSVAMNIRTTFSTGMGVSPWIPQDG